MHRLFIQLGVYLWLRVGIEQAYRCAAAIRSAAKHRLRSSPLRHSTSAYARLKAVVRLPDILARGKGPDARRRAGPESSRCPVACSLPRGTSESLPRPAPPALTRRTWTRRQRTVP